MSTINSFMQMAVALILISWFAFIVLMLWETHKYKEWLKDEHARFMRKMDDELEEFRKGLL